MSKRFKKVLAILSLVFMVLFAVSVVLTCFDAKLLNGAIGYTAMFTGFLGISIFFVIKLSTTDEGKTESNSDEKLLGLALKERTQTQQGKDDVEGADCEEERTCRENICAADQKEGSE